MAAQTIQDFLVSVGYQVDKAAQAEVQKGLKNNTYLAVELGKAFLSAADNILRAVESMARAMDDLYFASKRTGAAVEGLKSISYAAAQLGSSAAGAMNAIEGIGRLIATNPGGENFLRGLGVQTRDTNNALLETAQITRNLGEVLSRRSLPEANIIAGMFGIDYRTLLAMREGMGGFEREYHRMMQAAGVDAQATARDANLVMTAMRSLGAAFDILGMKITQALAKDTARQLEHFRDFIVNNFDLISHIVEGAASVFLSVVETVGRLVLAAGDGIRQIIIWFQGMDEATKTAILTLGALLVAWRVLNAGIMASPMGMILAFGAALALLYEDYKTWKEGGSSLINWDKWEGEIRAALAGIEPLQNALMGLWKSITENLIPSLEQLALQFNTSVGGMFRGSLATDINNFIGSLKELVTYLTHVVDLYAAISRGDWKGALAIAQAIKDQIAGGAPSAEERARRRAALGEQDLATLSAEDQARLANRYGSTGEGGADNRSWWQRTMPGWLGGTSAPGGGGGGGAAAPGGGGGGLAPPGGPVAPVTPTPAGQIGPNARYIHDQMIGAGYSEAQVAGMMGHIRGESWDGNANDYNPQAYNREGGNHGAQGIGQWRGPRVDAFRAQYGHMPREGTIQEQVAFMLNELRTTEQNSGAALRASQSPQQAAEAMVRLYGRPFPHDLPVLSQQRQGWAGGWHRMFAGGTGPTAVTPRPTPGPTFGPQQQPGRPGQAPGLLGRPTPPPATILSDDPIRPEEPDPTRGGRIPTTLTPEQAARYQEAQRIERNSRATMAAQNEPLVSPTPGATANDNRTGKDVSLHQETNIHVHGAGDPTGTAQAVGQEQGRVNELATRNLASAVR